MSGAPFGLLADHLRQLRSALADLDRQSWLLERWGAELAEVLICGGRLLAAGNGGSAAEAQHLTAELVGRFETERRPLSAIALHAETSSTTAIMNDFGGTELFARQVEAHGRPGDVLLLLSTSGRSPNLIRAAERGLQQGLQVWAMTGRRPNPLAAEVDQLLAIDSSSGTVIQEVQLVAVHGLCAAIERCLSDAEPETDAAGPNDLAEIPAVRTLRPVPSRAVWDGAGSEPPQRDA